MNKTRKNEKVQGKSRKDKKQKNLLKHLIVFGLIINKFLRFDSKIFITYLFSLLQYVILVNFFLILEYFD